MLKKIAIVSVFVLTVASLGSCRSKKNSCGYSKNEVKENIQQVQDDVVACLE